MMVANHNATRRDYFYLTLLTTAISIAALLFYFRHGAILLYGDATAHINIARRVFDSRTPGLFQLGTVWLPLPHLLDIPFILNDRMWRTGVGASIPSMAAYVAGALGIFQLLKTLASRAAVWAGALIYALNPNLLYMQTTAMTETLYLALMIWSVVFFSEFVQRRAEPATARRALEKCALVVSAAMLVRYDGWFLAATIVLAMGITVWRFHLGSGPIRRGAISFLLLTSLTAGVWLAYNHGRYGRALEFAIGPYSARAIMARSLTETMPTYPGQNNLHDAALYFLKVSRLTLGTGISETFLFTMAFIALLAMIYFSRRFLPLALLWVPLVFYVLSIAWGSVPVYFPEWWPHSYYNVRYGLQMLPAVAIFVALAYEFARKFFPARYVTVALIALVGFSYFSVWRTTPICLREAIANGKDRLRLEQALAAELVKLPPSAVVMMDCGAHSGAAQIAGIPFRRVLRESNPPEWEVGLTQPARAADYVVAFQDDQVWRAVHLFHKDLVLVTIIAVPGQPRAYLFRSRH